MELRPATSSDRDRLFRWANDPDTRTASFNTGPIAWDTHVAWFARRLADPDTRIFIAEVDGTPVGQVRFQRDAAEWEISIVVAPDARGKGFAVEMIRGGTALVDGKVIAKIKTDNTRSIRAFSAAGYELAESRDGEVVYQHD